MRRCEKCGGPGPCLWAERGPDCQRYLCRRCHPNPEDGFFTRTIDAVRAQVRPAEPDDPPATRAVMLDLTPEVPDRPALRQAVRHALDDAFLLHLVDVVWGVAHEDVSVPDTEWARRMIAKARETFSPELSESDFADAVRSLHPTTTEEES